MDRPRIPFVISCFFVFLFLSAMCLCLVTVAKAFSKKHGKCLFGFNIVFHIFQGCRVVDPAHTASVSATQHTPPHPQNNKIVAKKIFLTYIHTRAHTHTYVYRYIIRCNCFLIGVRVYTDALQIKLL